MSDTDHPTPTPDTVRTRAIHTATKALADVEPATGDGDSIDPITRAKIAVDAVLDLVTHESEQRRREVDEAFGFGDDIRALLGEPSWDDLVQGVRDMQAARRAHDAALSRIERLHPPREVPPIYPIDTRLGRPGYTECATCYVPYPCPTIREINGSTSE